MITKEEREDLVDLIEDLRRDLMMCSVAELITLPRVDRVLAALQRPKPQLESGACQHRELLREALRDVAAWLAEYRDENQTVKVAEYEDRVRRIQATIAPCQPAQGEDGEWETVATAAVTDIGASISMPVGASRGTHVLTISGVQIHAGDRVRIYRRRAGQGGAK